MQGFEGTKERIKQMFDKIELSVSSYDTAWVAMVPSPDSPQDPCFPQCIHWLMENQLNDGSWGLPNRPSWLVKDTLSCTLASVLALKRWGIGEEQMHKGKFSLPSFLLLPYISLVYTAQVFFFLSQASNLLNQTLFRLMMGSNIRLLALM